MTRADQARDPYLLVPFDVPAGVPAIRVRFRHDPTGDADRPTEGAVIDLGLFEPGSTAIGTAAFRGWSGSERSVVSVGESQATPGYLPGPVAAGTWHAALGLYGIPVGGARYWLDVDLLDREGEPTDGPSTAPADPAATAVSMPPTDGWSRWLACDLHVHSVHSDGVDELVGLARAARRRGLDALVVTDHNTSSHHPWLAGAGQEVGMALLPGEEVTTYRGHMNAIGGTAWVDFRHQARDGVVGAIQAIRRSGGLASINHPRRNSCSWEWGDVPADLMEIWNGVWSNSDQASLDWWYELASAAMDLPIGDGQHAPTPVGGSDCHDSLNPATPLGTPTTWVETSGATRTAIVSGLAAGRTAVTASPQERPPLINRSGSTIVWDLAPATGRRLLLRGAAGIVRDLPLSTGSRDGHSDVGVDAARIVLAAEIRGPSEELIALVPLISARD